MQSKIMRALKDMGFDLRYHAFRTHRLDSAGYLDVTAIHRPSGLLWTAELKGPTGVVSDDQRAWIDGWHKVRRIHCADVIFPVDYDRAIDDVRRLLNVGRS